MMKKALLISIAVFTVACERSHQTHTDTSANATGAGSLGANTSAAPASELSSNTVTLVGCLQGPHLSGVTGSSGTLASDRANAPTAGNEVRERQTHGAADTGPFVLANAAVESGGGGASGAGESGGPVATTGLSFELDGVPADAQASVNKLVRVTGRLARAAATPTKSSGTTAAGGGGISTAAASTTAATSTKDDVRANSTGVAGDSTNHRLMVGTVQVVAQKCGPQ
jgi:hypothetical protein